MSYSERTENVSLHARPSYSRLGRIPYRHLVIYLVFAWGIEDTVTTLLAASLVGPGHEVNPLVRYTLEVHPLLAVGLKVGAAVVVGLVALWGERFITAIPYWRPWFVGLTFLGMVVSAVNLVVAWQAVAATAAGVVFLF